MLSVGSYDKQINTFIGPGLHRCGRGLHRCGRGLHRCGRGSRPSHPHDPKGLQPRCGRVFIRCGGVSRPRRHPDPERVSYSVVVPANYSQIICTQLVSTLYKTYSTTLLGECIPHRLHRSLFPRPTLILQHRLIQQHLRPQNHLASRRLPILNQLTTYTFLHFKQSN